MSFRLLVADLDGTLIGRNSAVSPRSKEAVSRLRQSGIRFSVCTGRMPIACAGILRELNLDLLGIFGNGALVGSPFTAQEIFCLPIDRTVAQDAVRFSRHTGMSIELYTREGCFVDARTGATELHASIQGIEPQVADLLDLVAHDKIIKASLVATTSEEKATTRRFGEEFKGRLALGFAKHPAYPGTDLINVTHPDVSKGRALAVLCRHLGVAREEVVAIGDGANDVPLLEAAGYGIAMGDAPPELKAVARCATLSVDEDGFAVAVEKLLA
ncbi:MAG: HAD family phosphatase [Chloroflexi bacterium]|nr:HAD family phosphatase [Chloroflexota bacterium]